MLDPNDDEFLCSNIRCPRYLYLIFISLLLGTSWVWTSAMQGVVASVYPVDENWEDYVKRSTDETKLFYENGILKLKFIDFGSAI